MAETELWLVDLRRCRQALADLEAEAPRLTAQDRRRARAIKNASDSADRLAIYTALRLLVERMAGADAARAPFLIAPGGKPRLAGGSGSFSLAHVDGCALIGLARSGEIGVDLETERAISMSPSRRAALITAAGGLSPRVLGGADPDARFLQAWARLEAFAKATGRGLSRTLTDLGVRGPTTAKTDELHAIAARCAREAGLTVHDMDVGPGLFAAAALTQPRCPAPVALPHHRAGLEALLRPRRHQG